MKAFIKQFFLFSLTSLVFFSCKKDENKIMLEGGTAPVLTATTTDSIPLYLQSDSVQAIKFSWTNPDYKFTTGVSSQDVFYALEFDTAGAGFSNPAKKVIAISKELSVSFTQAEINDIVISDLNLKDSILHTIEVRVVSTLANSTARLVSNSLSFSVIPYLIPPKVIPPSTDSLYITGNATPGNWQTEGDAELVSQKFRRETEFIYVMDRITLIGGNSYLFLPRYGTWTALPPDPNKYGFTGNNNENNVFGDTFKEGGGDIKAPPDGGDYKITVDFQRGRFTLVKL